MSFGSSTEQGQISGLPDWRPKSKKRRERRGRDAKTTKRLHLTIDECAACGRSDVPLALHHVLYGGPMRYRLDDERNLLALCTTSRNEKGETIDGCHVLFHAGDPLTLERIAIALALRPDIIEFVTEALGDVAGRDYLRRRYRMEIA